LKNTFHENPTSRSRVVLRGRTDGRTERQTDMMKLMAAFRNCAKAPKDVSVTKAIN